MSAESRKRLSGDERRQQILDAALGLFSQKGFSATRTRDIAQKAGISEALIFQHFAGKEDLYQTALTSLFAHHPVMDDIQEAMAAKDDEAVLYELALHMLHHTKEDPRIVRLSLFSGLEGLKPHHQTKAGPGHDPLEVLTTYLTQRLEDGALRDLDPGLTSRFFFYAVMMYAADQDLCVLGDPLPLAKEQVARAAAQLFWQGIKR